ncbi:uncharacterized protein LOC111257069 [Setaria italica]|uniref:uncharacterized protein LOC111257069 n=1 Tax=Setaria italica TaxID=4555 RepID=UPI000648C683|nr:uncharacterized protein LOC111257069 [Setaria italica]
MIAGRAAAGGAGGGAKVLRQSGVGKQEGSSEHVDFGRRGYAVVHRFGGFVANADVGKQPAQLDARLQETYTLARYYNSLFEFSGRVNEIWMLFDGAKCGDDTYGEERAVEKLLRCIPEKYKQIASSIESLLDLSRMSIKEAIGRLKVVDSDESQPPSGPVIISGKLHFTQEQWEVRQGDRKKGEPSSSRGGHKRGKPHKAPKAHVALALAEELALLLAHASIELSPAASATAALLHLDEPRVHAFLGDGSSKDKTEGWCLNTGATKHMTGRREFFTELDSSIRGTVKFRDASSVEIKGVGSVIFITESGEDRLLTGVYYIPVTQPFYLAARRDDEVWQWHERFGHLHFEALKRLSAKEMRRLPLPQQASFRAKERFELVHGDLCGLVTPATPGGRCYLLLLVDDLSRYMWVMVLGSKGEAADAIRRTQAAAEVECGRKLRVLRTDNSGEFMAAEFALYCADEGIQRHYSTPYSLQQNGVVEWGNHMVVGMTRALLKQRGMPAVLWGEVVVMAIYILNRSPTKTLDGRMPYEPWHGRKPAVSHLRVFGCLAFAKELGHISKLDNSSTPGVFIGYVEGLKAYRILDPETQCVRIARDVVFDEGRGWAWDKAVDDGSTPMYDDFTVEYVHFEGAGGVGSSSSPSVPTLVPEPPPTPTPATPVALRSPAATSAATRFSPAPPQPATPHTPAPTTTPPGTSTPTPAHVKHSLVQFATPLSHDEERIDAYHDSEQLRYRMMEDLLGEQPVLGLVSHDLEAQLHLACDDGEPRSFTEAERHAAWHAAMQSEMDAVEKNRTWELADLPRGHHMITLKFMQQEGIDYDDAFTPMARMDSVRLLFALAAREGWRVHHMDIKSAFLNGDLKEEVYVHQPPGFVILGKEGKVLRLRKVLYGLQQAPRAWNAKLDSTLKGMGLEQSPHEAAIYRRGNGENALLVGVYIDDLVITGTKDAERPTMEHQQVVKRIVRYVAGTLDHGLFYTRCPGAAHFIGYSNSDHAGDIDTSKSTSGILFFLGKCLVSCGFWVGSGLSASIVDLVQVQDFDGRFSEILYEYAGRNLCVLGAELGQDIGGNVMVFGNMVELEAVEVGLKFVDFHAVSVHGFLAAVPIFIDLLDDNLRVVISKDAFDSQGNSDA